MPALRARASTRRRQRTSADEARRRVKQALNQEAQSGPSGALTPIKRTGSNANLECLNGDSMCEAPTCNHPKCSLKISPKCCSQVSRWYHVSAAEHFCSSCQEELVKPGRSKCDGHTEWRKQWSNGSRREPNIRTFVADELLSFWLQCCECGKWRAYNQPLPADHAAFIAGFTCQQTDPVDQQPDTKPSCELPEQKVIHELPPVKEWIQQLGVPVLLQRSPSLFYLHDWFYYDEIGLSPVNGLLNMDSRDSKLEAICQPFHIPGQVPTALCVRADVQEYDELVAFPEYACERSMYLGLRNLIIALWGLQPDAWLDESTCLQRVLCRGLNRIYACRELPRVWRFLTSHGVINFGCIKPPVFPSLPPFVAVNNSPSRKPKYDVVIVGGGISGLCAARHLTNQGARVLVLEAKAHTAGRMRDDWSLGVAVGCGAQLITGIVNNPIVTMCYQTNTPYKPLADTCPLQDAATGQAADVVADKRVDFHFNCILDAIAEHKKDRPNATDTTLDGRDQFMHMHNLFLTQSNSKWSTDEDRIFHWQLGNVEFSCGAKLDQVSAHSWDQNEQFTQFAGEHALLVEGAQSFLQGLQDGIDVRCSTAIRQIDYANPDVVTVTDQKGHRFTAHKVLVTASLAVLQHENIRFKPQLPADKRTAINSLGAGCIEKVAVRFPHDFWSKHVGATDYFGHVPKENEDRGLFNMFYDLSNKSNNSFVLMSYVCGDKLDLVNQHKDPYIVEQFVEVLQDMFADEVVPEPLGSVVTRWRRDPHIGMSYSYVKLGSHGSTYDQIAKPVQSRIFFAGEATNRFFPQTMTGAYLSGLRESAKIMKSLLLDRKPKQK